MEERRSRPPGRPPLDPSITRLIVRLARENSKWGYLRIRGELLKLGIDVSATTLATVLRRSGLGPAPRRLGPTSTQFLRAQASGLRCRESRAGVQDSLLGLAVAPHQEAPVPDTDDPATADLDAIHDPSRRNGWPIPMVVARPPGPVTPTWPGGHARDRPAMAV